MNYIWYIYEKDEDYDEKINKLRSKYGYDGEDCYVIQNTDTGKITMRSQRDTPYKGESLELACVKHMRDIIEEDKKYMITHTTVVAPKCEMIRYGKLKTGDKFLYCGEIYIKAKPKPINLVDGSALDIGEKHKITPIDVKILYKITKNPNIK